MSLIDKLKEVYDELTNDDFDYRNGTIILQDDSDGQGAYITKWEYSKKIPEGYKVGK